MITIHELLNRNWWDQEFAKWEFQLGYHDRTEDRILLLPLKEVTLLSESPQTFQPTDLERQIHRVPIHRVREDYRDSQRMWHRPDSPSVEVD